MYTYPLYFFPAGHVPEEEYLAVDRHFEGRLEYFDGQIYEIPPSPVGKSQMGMNLIGAFHRKRLPPHCHALGCKMRVYSSQSRAYLFPDLLIFSGKPECPDPEQENLTNPMVVFEVYTSETAGHVYTRKLPVYRSMPSIREFVVISSHKVHVEHYYRDAHQEWTLREYQDLSAAVPFVSLPASLPLAEIYDDIERHTVLRQSFYR